MFDIEITGIVLLGLILGSMIGLAIELVLFKAACALADVNNPSWPRCFLAIVPLFFGRVLLAMGIYWQMERLFPDFVSTTLSGTKLDVLCIVASGLVFWLVYAGLYSAILSVSLRKSFFTASAQVILDALAGSLAFGVVLIVLSIVQIKQGPVNKTAWQLGPVDALATIERGSE